MYEEKYDGYRILAYKEEKRVTLLSRNGKDRTESFADVAKAVATLRDRTLLLDGEAVAFDRRLVSVSNSCSRGRSRSSSPPSTASTATGATCGRSRQDTERSSRR